LVCCLGKVCGWDGVEGEGRKWLVLLRKDSDRPNSQGAIEAVWTGVYRSGACKASARRRRWQNLKKLRTPARPAPAALSAAPE